MRLWGVQVDGCNVDMSFCKAEQNAGKVTTWFTQVTKEDYTDGYSSKRPRTAMYAGIAGDIHLYKAPASAGQPTRHRSGTAITARCCKGIVEQIISAAKSGFDEAPSPRYTGKTDISGHLSQISPSCRLPATPFLLNNPHPCADRASAVMIKVGGIFS